MSYGVAQPLQFLDPPGERALRLDPCADMHNFNYVERTVLPRPGDRSFARIGYGH